MPLPPGLTPVEAGRIGLWLLGQRKRRAGLHRRKRNPQRAFNLSLLGRFGLIACPWRIVDYPSAEMLIAQLTGLSMSTVDVMLRLRRPDMAARHARTLADYIERFDGVGLARELREYADARDARIGKRAPRVRRTGRDKSAEQHESDGHDPQGN
jgi:hypothetical protein